MVNENRVASSLAFDALAVVFAWNVTCLVGYIQLKLQDLLEFTLTVITCMRRGRMLEVPHG